MGEKDKIILTDKTVLIVNGSESFLANGLVSKLKTAGINTINIGKKINELEENHSRADLFILFMDDKLNEHISTLTFLKELVSNGEKKLLLIGEPTQYDYVVKYIDAPLVSQYFERPIDMEEFLKAVARYLSPKKKDLKVKKNILIVDDDITYMRTVYEWLKDDYNVGMAATGMQAIGYLTKNKADLVLLDYEMPVIKGPQIMEMLKSDSETGSIPVMFLTGHGDKESVMSVINLKPVDYLLKSIDKLTLRAKLKAFFDKIDKK